MKKVFRILALAFALFTFFSLSACESDDYTVKEAKADFSLATIETDVFYTYKGKFYFNNYTLDLTNIQGAIIGVNFNVCWYGERLYFPTVINNTIYISSCNLSGTNLRDEVILSNDYKKDAPVSVKVVGETLYVTHGNSLCVNGEKDFRVLDSYNVKTGEVVNNIAYGSDIYYDYPYNTFIVDTFYEDEDDDYEDRITRVTEMVSKKQIILDEKIIKNTLLNSLLDKYDAKVDEVEILSETKFAFTYEMDLWKDEDSCASDYTYSYATFVYDIETDSVSFAGFFNNDDLYTYTIGAKVI